MARPRSYITKAELATVLGLSKGRVTQLISKGMPVRTDGKVNRDEALRWYRDAGLAEQSSKRGPKPRRPAAAKIQGGMVAEQSPGTTVAGDEGALLAGYTRTVQREVLDLLRAKAAELPALLHKLGAPPLGVLLAAEIWDAVFFAALSPRIVELYGPLGPAPIVEGADQELADRLGIPFDQIGRASCR